MHVVCFDLGGVLVEINHHWKGALLDAGVPLERAASFDVPLTDFEPFNAYQKGEIDLDSYLLTLESYFGGDIKGLGLAAHNAILRTAYPGIPELIAEVQASGLATGCLSNTNAPHWDAMFHEPRLAVLATLDFPIASHLVGAEKPDARMYEAFEAASGAQGEQIVYFDDAFGNVDAAAARSWQAFRIDPLGDPAQEIRAHLRHLGLL